MFESCAVPKERSPYGRKKYDVIAFTDKGFSLDVRVDPDKDTVWLTKDQMAMLFDRDRSVISRHIKSIYNEGELSEKVPVHFLHAYLQPEKDHTNR